MKTAIKTTRNSMLRNITLASLVALALIIGQSEAKGQGTYFTLDTVVADPGTSITMSVTGHNLSNVSAITLYVNFSAGLTYSGASNWNPLFDNGYNLANGIGGLAAIVWFNLAPVTATTARIVDLHFNYSSGMPVLNFEPSCEVADQNGMPLSPAPQYFGGLVVPTMDVDIFHGAGSGSTSICPGTSLNLVAYASGGYGTFTYQWSSSPAGINTTGWTITVQPSVPTWYFVTATGSGFVDTDSILVDFYPDLPVTPVSGMIPADSAGNLPSNPTFSWFPGANALLYDFYLWKEGNSMPQTPSYSDLNKISLTKSGLSYDSRYYWKVVAKNNCYDTTSPIFTFTTKALPNSTSPSWTTLFPSQVRPCRLHGQ